MNTAGHQNDTIVVNQPRLTADDGIANINAAAAATTPLPPQLEMTIITDEQGNQKIVHTNTLVSGPRYDLIWTWVKVDTNTVVLTGFPISFQTQEVTGEQKLYIHEMKDHILIPDEQNPDQQHNLHIVMDGQVEVKMLEYVCKVFAG